MTTVRLRKTRSNISRPKTTAVCWSQWHKDRIVSNTRRSLVPAPESGIGHWQMLRGNIRAQPQSHSRRPPALRDRSCHRNLDPVVHRSPLPKVTLSSSRWCHNAAAIEPPGKCPAAKCTIPVHADIRKQRSGDGMLESTSPRADMDHHRSP